MTITFITGANKSLGYETARRLIELGHTVLIGARDAERGAAAAAALGPNARFVPIDVADEASVAAAAADVAAREGHIDVLINNAGVVGTHTSGAEITGADAEEVFAVNVTGIVRSMHHFVPLLERSASPVVVDVASGMGSHALVEDPERVESQWVSPLYSASKAAVVMLATQYARQLPGIRINAVDPGYTSTDFNAHRGEQTVTEGTDAIVAMATIGSDGPSGTFTDRFGVVPW